MKLYQDFQIIQTHIGWNKITSNDNILNDKEYYFCHSYFAR